MGETTFSTLYTFFDQAVVSVISTGTTSMIALISPLLAVCFGIYVMLILSSYWKGDNDEPVMDFFYRMIGWAAVITFGLNISMYQQYVAPFVSGLGDDLAGVVGAQNGNASALDSMLQAFVTSFTNLYNEANGISETVFALIAIVIEGIFAAFFMVIAVTSIMLAKLALGLLVAVGPLFISAALFPATRTLFKNWTAQCLNYAFLVMLFSFVTQIEIGLVNGMISQDITIASVLETSIVCYVFVDVARNLPSLAAALAGGIGISAMVRPKRPQKPKEDSKPKPDDETITGKGGGEIAQGRGQPTGGSVSAEQRRDKQ